MFHRVAADADVRAFDGAHVAQILRAKQSAAHVHVQRKQKCGERKRAGARGHNKGYRMQFRAPSFQLIQAGTASWFWRLLRSAVVATYENGGLGTAKGVAYSGLLAFFPVLTTLAAVLVQARADDVARTIAALLYDVVPPGTEDVVRT